MELDLAYLCKEVREIARASATFLKEERRKFDRNLVEEKSAHNYVSYVDKEIGTTDHRGFCLLCYPRLVLSRRKALEV